MLRKGSVPGTYALILFRILKTIGDTVRHLLFLLITIPVWVTRQIGRVSVHAMQSVLGFLVPQSGSDIRSGYLSLRNSPVIIKGDAAFRMHTVRNGKRRKLILKSFKIGRRWILSFFQQPFFMFLTGILFAGLFLYVPLVSFLWLRTLPNPKLLSNRSLDVSTKIFDRNGTLLYEIYAEQNRTPLTLSEIPTDLKHATIAIEDKEFYYHDGVSVRGILRALREIIVHRQIQGGSTITQQLIKSALLTPEVTLSRKITEIVLAFWTEQIYSKDQILEMYLNQVPYGGTAWGVEAASQTYFGKSARDLTLPEAALLAGLPAAPSDYSPFGAHPEKAFERQVEVLRRMVEERYISKKDLQESLSTPIRLAPQQTAIRAPHFVMYVKDLLSRVYGARRVERGGMRIITSLDYPLQEQVQSIVQRQLQSLSSLNVGNGGVVVTNPASGEILSMVGSRDYFDTVSDGNVNVTTSLRQPGSSIKVVTYALALESKKYTAASLISDTPVVYPNPGGIPYAPVNYDSTFHGWVSLRNALGNSYNIPAVRLLSSLGVQEMVRLGRLMGIRSWPDDRKFGLSLTLGSGEVTMLDMARVYGTLANSGLRQELIPLLQVTDYSGNVLDAHIPGKPIRALRPETAWIISDILADNQARLQAFGPNSSLVIPDRRVSVKTGTSNDKRDNWTIGYTPSFVVVVWVGNNDNSPMHPTLTSGITGAAPIWHDVMTGLLADRSDELPGRPAGVVSIPCYQNRTEYFIAGTEPRHGQCGSLPTNAPSRKP